MPFLKRLTIAKSVCMNLLTLIYKLRTSMKKIHQLIVALIVLTFSSTSFAEMKYGVSGALTLIEASGTETEGGEKNSGEADNLVAIPSIFAEYVLSDTLSVGIDYIPLKADVSDKAKKRSDTETSVTGTTTTTSTSRTQSAQAELENHITLYANYNLDNGLYVKGGVASVSLNTDESLGTGSKYGNDDILGYLIGFGVDSGNWRTEITYTDYEDISLTSTVARSGVTTNNKIDADLDTIALRVSYAF